MCTNQDISNIPFIMRENHFLVHGKKGFTSYYMHFSSFKICSQTFLGSANFHHISLLRLLPKSYFKKITFQPNFLCSSSFKWCNQRDPKLYECTVKRYIMSEIWTRHGRKLLFTTILVQIHNTAIYCSLLGLCTIQR